MKTIKKIHISGEDYFLGVDLTEEQMASLKGEKGDKGDKGDQGEQGIQGEVGPQGPQGPQGEVGPQGPQGPQGEVGPQGPQGPAGESSSVDLTDYYTKTEIDNKLNIPAIKFSFSNSGSKEFDKTDSDIIKEAFNNKTTIAFVSNKNSDYRGWTTYFDFAQAQIYANDCYFIKAIGFYSSYSHYQDLYVIDFMNLNSTSNIYVSWEPIDSYNYYKKSYIDNKFASLPPAGSTVTPVLEADLPSTPDDKVYIVYEETSN